MAKNARRRGKGKRDDESSHDLRRESRRVVHEWQKHRSARRQYVTSGILGRAVQDALPRLV